MRTLAAQIHNAAPTDATVLILGESGTGKERVARTLHDLSARKAGPFIKLNVAAVPRELTESVLFGHDQGAFPGADTARAGAFELADGGTLFLDEIGDIEAGLQAKLLHFLQDRSVQRVGNAKVIPVDVRVLAATNRDLADRVASGLFREDLYYRLNVVPVRIPPLRERKEEIASLAADFVRKAGEKYGKPDRSLSPAAVEALLKYDWPGNVRQLENAVYRAVILEPEKVIGSAAFSEELRASEKVLPPATDDDAGMRLVDQIEKRSIIDALRIAFGNVKKAANQLGLSPATLYRKVKRYRIRPADYEKPL